MRVRAHLANAARNIASAWLSVSCCSGLFTGILSAQLCQIRILSLTLLPLLAFKRSLSEYDSLGKPLSFSVPCKNRRGRWNVVIIGAEEVDGCQTQAAYDRP